MRNELEARYAAMSDEEMKEFGSQYDSLTDEAQALVRAEFKRRGLETPEAKEIISYEYQRLITIRKYRDQPEASLARSLLESAGIECFLQDENIVRITWQNSNFLDGIKLQVAPADVEYAEAILSEPIPSSIAVEGADYAQPKCPECGSLDINFYSSNLKAATASLYLLGIPLPPLGQKRYWLCNQCGIKWVDETDGLSSQEN